MKVPYHSQELSEYHRPTKGNTPNDFRNGTLYPIKSIPGDVSQDLLSNYPALTQFINNTYFFHQFESDSNPLEIEIDGGRTASLTNVQVQGLNIHALGFTDRPCIQDFAVSIKGVGTYLAEHWLEHLPAEIAAGLREKPIILPQDAFSSSKPYGGHSFLDGANSHKQEWIKNFYPGLLKLAPYIGCAFIPDEVVDFFNAKNNLLQTYHDYGYEYYQHFHEMTNDDYDPCEERIGPEDFRLVQEFRLMPSQYRASSFFAEQSNEELEYRVASLLASYEGSYSKFIITLLQDSVRMMESFPRTLRYENGKLKACVISDFYGNYKTVERFARFGRHFGLYSFIKDIVVAPTGAYFVDWESVDINNLQNPNTYHEKLATFFLSALYEQVNYISRFRAGAEIAGETKNKDFQAIQEETKELLFEELGKSRYIQLRRMPVNYYLAWRSEQGVQGDISIPNEAIII